MTPLLVMLREELPWIACNINMEGSVEGAHECDSFYTRLLLIARYRSLQSSYVSSYRNREAAQPRQGDLSPRGCTTTARGVRHGYLLQGASSPLG